MGHLPIINSIALICILCSRTQTSLGQKKKIASLFYFANITNILLKVQNIQRDDLSLSCRLINSSQIKKLMKP